MKQRWLTAAAIAASLLMSACAGGSGGSPAAVPNVTSPSSSLTATAMFTVVIPNDTALSGARQAKYLTPAVKGIDFQTQQDLSPAGATQTQPSDRGYVFYALTPTSSYCTTGPTAMTCTLPVLAYPGQDLITVNTYDNTNPSTPFGNGGPSHIISTGFVTATILPGVNNPISITTSGVVTFMTMGLDNPFPPTGASLTQPIRLLAMDANDYIIIGNYDSPLAASSSDTTGGITVSSTSIPNSSTLPNVVYNGTNVSANVLVKTTSFNTTINTRFTFIQTFARFIPNNRGYYPTPATVLFGHASAAAQTVTVTGTGTAPALALADVNNADNQQNPKCSGIVTASVSGSTVTITPVKAGVCGLWLTGGTGATLTTGTIPIVVSP